MDKKTIAVLIPCYNEKLTIGKVVSDFRRELPDSDIYVYDNNSTDGTALEACIHGAVIRKEEKQGKGNVVRRMCRDIDADCYVLVDGDDTYPAEAVHELVRPVIDGTCDLVIGDRLSESYFAMNNRRFHSFGNRLVCGLIRLLYGKEIRDVMTGYRAFGRRVAKDMVFRSEGFEIETEMALKCIKEGMRIGSVPVGYRNRPKGSVSKLNTFRDGAKILFMIFRNAAGRGIRHD